MNINQIGLYFEAPKSGVYKIEVIPTGHVYYGSSFNIRTRVLAHKSKLNKGAHYNEQLQGLFNEHGLENFRAAIVEECLQQDLTAREQFWISSQLFIAPEKLLNIYKIATRAKPEVWTERKERWLIKFREKEKAFSARHNELLEFVTQRANGICERCNCAIPDNEYSHINHMVSGGALIDAIFSEYVFSCRTCENKHSRNCRLTRKLCGPLFFQTRKREDMKGFNNLGKPVTIERFNNARIHLKEMYPEWSSEQHTEVLRAAKKLVEADDPDSIWGHVNAHPPLDKMDWVSRMRLGAAMLAE